MAHPSPPQASSPSSLGGVHRVCGSTTERLPVLDTTRNIGSCLSRMPRTLIVSLLIAFPSSLHEGRRSRDWYPKLNGQRFYQKKPPKTQRGVDQMGLFSPQCPPLELCDSGSRTREHPLGRLPSRWTCGPPVHLDRTPLSTPNHLNSIPLAVHSIPAVAH